VFRSLVTLFAAGALLLACPAWSAQDEVAGLYRIQDGPDVASELDLRPDGRFVYFLAAGSLDEQAEGTWRVEGSHLRLTTSPKPVAAVFSPGVITSTDDSALELHVTDPAGNGIAAVDFVIGFDTGEAEEGYTQDYGWSLKKSETRSARWIELSVPMYGLRSPRFPLDLTSGNNFVFYLTPNDLGTLDFEGIEIDITRGGLVVHRNGAAITYRAAGAER
jgi:hypothetical protein